MAKKAYRPSKPSYSVLAEVHRQSGGDIHKAIEQNRVCHYDLEQCAALLRDLEQQGMVKLDGGTVSITAHGNDTVIRYILH
jgi:predicted methyltransferase